jgi:Mn2+/Fe2+ NRAMP family transporter
MQAFNNMPGRRFGKAHWSIWAFFVMMVFKILQLGGIIGGVAIILQLILPGVPIFIITLVVAVVVALMVYQGYYRTIEKFSLIMIGLFTLLTFTCLYFLKFTEYSISANDIWQGLQFKLPATAVAIAIGAFGITGVGGDEIIAYNYWCLEKGYAAKSGIREDSAAWRSRATGWIKVMHYDAVASMIVYTLMTAAFYLLGAAVLHASGSIPEGYAMIETLSTMYTESLGPGAKSLFMAGAFMVLFSTLFAALAQWTRQYSDIFGQIGWIDFFNQKDRLNSIKILSWALPLSWALIFLFIKLPVTMIIAGGFITSLILLLVIWVVIHFRYKKVVAGFEPRLIYDILLWVSILATLIIVIYSIIQLTTG